MRSLKLQRIAGILALGAFALQLSQPGSANSGFGVNTDINGNTINVPTYFANTQSGTHPAFDPVLHDFSPTTITTSVPSTNAVGTVVSVSISPMAPISETGAAIDATGLVVTVGSTANLVAGDGVYGGGFPVGAKIVAITSATTFTVSTAAVVTVGIASGPAATGVSLWLVQNPGTVFGANATTTAAGATVNIGQIPVVGALVVGGGFPVGTTVTSVTQPRYVVDTGAPLRKFVTPMGGVYNGLEALASQTDLQVGIPIGIPEHNWVNPFNGVQTKDDYYEIAVVEYTQQMHADLVKPTRLRGYVQIETPNIVAGNLKDITGVVGSEHIPGVYPDGSAILDATGKQVYFVHKPHYLGPTLLVAHGTALRIKYTNYLPYTDATGRSVGSWNGTGGEIPLPIDETIPGGGAVLDSTGAQIYAKNAAGQPILDASGNPVPVKMGQNRASVHWHGGDTPWTNDGTPHQWFAPAGDIAYTLGVDARHPYGLGKGESTTGHSVGDMPDPGPGSYNLYFPNQVLSGRLMMYHDHASGLTRPNAYIGEAAGYLVYDPTELTLASNAIGEPLAQVGSGATAGLPTGLLDAVGIPLVVQDKGFVPKNIGPAAVATDTTTGLPAPPVPASQDARWDLAHWGQPGDLFFPHVYETNQDPNAIDGTNPVGRWDWGPWFWPVFPAQYSLPTGAYGDVTTTPEAFMNTPTVNGQAYPVLTVDPKTYRFRILSIANDRSFDLGLYQAVDANGVVCDKNNPTPALPPRAAGDVSAAGPATCTEVRMVPASPNPAFPSTWPTDGRMGGVPDPATAGPDIVQIGNEAGLLPQVAVWKSQPIVYEQNVRSITVFNVLNHDLLLMGAERADVLIDFTNYAGQTLILYNDSAAPLPGFDPRIDFFTGDGDQTGSGGDYNTLAGYGTNTRTVMQIKVNATNTSGVGGPLNVAALQTALPVAYAATQPAPIIPESVYNSAFGTSNVDNYATIGTGSAAKPTFFINGNTSITLTGILISTGGLVYPAGTTLTIDPPSCTPLQAPSPTATCAQATATPVVTRGVITGYTNWYPGAGYTQVPAITFSAFGADGVAAVAKVTSINGYSIINKAIQELFDTVFGRMNATLAVELPYSSATVATTIPLAYIDTPNDYFDTIKEGETQIWKITHNGVDSHPVHFHLVNVQVINRVGWDGVIKPPSPAEVGWRETLRMNPLEDVYVAVRAAKPVTPYGLPGSARLMDPSIAVGSTLGITQIDPVTGNAPVSQTYYSTAGVNAAGVFTLGPLATVASTSYTNQLSDFDNEYVWHCHILGHEEFDFMRPFVFHPNVIVPDAPGTVTTSGATVTWVDPTPFGGQDAQGIPTAGVNAAYPVPTASPKNEIGFRIYNAAGTLAGTAVANSTKWTDPAGANGPYTVTAYNAAGESVPGTSTTVSGGSSTVTPPATPTAPTGTQIVTATIDSTGLNVTLSAAPATALVVGASVSGGGFPAGTMIATVSSTTTFTTTLASTTPSVTGVALTISLGAVAPLPTQPASGAPTGLVAVLNAAGTVTLTWNAVAGATAYTVSINDTTLATTTSVPVAPVAGAATVSYTTAAINATSVYTFSVTATTLSGTTVAATTAPVSNAGVAAPVAFAGAADAVPGTITLSWANAAVNKNNVKGITLTWTPAGGAAVSYTFAPGATGTTLTGLTTGTAYSFTLQAVGMTTGNNSAVLATFVSGVAATVTAP